MSHVLTGARAHADLLDLAGGRAISYNPIINQDNVAAFEAHVNKYLGDWGGDWGGNITSMCVL